MSYVVPPDGWFTFGTHIDSDVQLSFSDELDEAGEPRWERPHASVYSWTRHQAMCSEQCGWEGTDDHVSEASALAEAQVHNRNAHGIPKPPPPGGWHWECVRSGCRWMTTVYSTEESFNRSIAEHLREEHSSTGGES